METPENVSTEGMALDIYSAVSEFLAALAPRTLEDVDAAGDAFRDAVEHACADHCWNHNPA